MTPSYLRDKLPPHSRPTNRRHNNPNTFVEITWKTSTYSNSFFHDAIKSWNGASREFQITPSFNFLKNIYIYIHVESLAW